MPKMGINLEVREVLSPLKKNTLLLVETQPSFETTHTGSKLKRDVLKQVMCFSFQGWKWFGEIEWDLSAEHQTQRPKIVQSPSRLR